MRARLLALLTDQRSIDGIAATVGMLLTVAAYTYLNRDEPSRPIEAMACVSVPYTPSERGGECYEVAPQ